MHGTVEPPNTGPLNTGIQISVPNTGIYSTNKQIQQIYFFKLTIILTKL